MNKNPSAIAVKNRGTGYVFRNALPMQSAEILTCSRLQAAKGGYKAAH